MAGLARRVILLVGVAVYALLAVISAADRGDLVPFGGALQVPPYPAQALMAQTRQHLSAGDYRGGLVVARRAVLANPVEPASPALLGAALLGVGDADGARRAFTVAGRMGWRVPLTQTYWMEAALAAHDFRAAALRFDALALQDAAIAAGPHPARAFESSAEGRQALAERLRRRPAWLPNYLDPAPEAGPDDLVGRAAVMQQLLSRGGGSAAECDRSARLVMRLVEASQAPVARALWRQACFGSGRSGGSGPAAGGLLLDGNLADLRQDGPQPFGWQLVSDPDVTIAPVAGASGGPAGGVVLANSAPGRRTALRQMVIAPPGRYRLSWITRRADGTPSDRVVAVTQCSSGRQIPFEARPGPSGGAWGGDFAVPGQCPAVWIEFQVLGGSQETTLSAVALAPLAP